jgi:hypothetical protein
MADADGELMDHCELLTEDMTPREIVAVLEDSTHRVAAEHAFLLDRGVCCYLRDVLNERLKQRKRRSAVV